MERVAEGSVGGCRRGERSSCDAGVEEMGRSRRTIRRGSWIGRPHRRHRPMMRAS